MPVRYLKPGVRDSELIDLLEPQTEVFFYRLLVTVDDFGRFDARPAMLKAACFPIKDSVSAKDCEAMLIALARAGLVFVYEADGGKVLQVQKWDNKPRASASKYPEFTDACAQMYADECGCPHVFTDVALTVTDNRKPETVDRNTHAARDAALDQRDTTGKPDRKRKQRLPDDFSLPDDWVAKAKDKGMTDATVLLEFEKFKGHHVSKGNLSASWASSWSAWCANWVSYGCRQVPVSSGSSGGFKTSVQIIQERTDAAIQEFLSDTPAFAGDVIDGECATVLEVGHA